MHVDKDQVSESEAPKRKRGPSKRPAAPAPTGKAGSGLLTIDDVASLLRVSVAQVRNLRARGQIPAGFRAPGLPIRWYAADFYGWLETLGSGAKGTA